MFPINLLRTQRQRPARTRKAAASVEFAICIPVLITLTIGTMDLCSIIFLKESVTLAAYEGARRGVGRDRTNAEATERVIEFLEDRDIAYDQSQLTSFSSPDFNSANTLDNVTITVQVPAEGNLIIPSSVFGHLTVSSSVTLRKEYRNLTSN